jgi:Dockerin type I domain/Thrombospondin type 3 repeat
VWAVGAGGDGDPISCDLSRIHHWDGQTWTYVPASAPDGRFWHSLDAVDAVAPDDVWVGGETFDGDYHGLSLHWNGSAWREAATPIGITDFVSFASDDVYAFGGAVAHCNGSARTLIESFPDVDSPSLTGADTAGVRDVWAGGRQLIGDQLTTLTVRTTARDTDNDGVPDGADNCTAVANPDQRDTNGDGYGNVCDPDLNNDGLVNFADLGMMKSVFFSGNADADLNGNGSVNFTDLGVLKAYFFGPPGPSALVQ